MIFFTNKKDISMLQERKGKKVKETSPSIDIPALHFADKLVWVNCKNTLVSISYTAWLISNRPGIRIHVSLFNLQSSHTLTCPNLKITGIEIFFWFGSIFRHTLEYNKIKTNYVVINGK